MGFLSNGTKSTTRRRGALVGMALGLAALTAVAMPGHSAFAGKPFTPHPLKPVVVATVGDVPVELSGTTNNSNACAGIYCHTYLAIMVKRSGTSTYKLYDGWKDISSLTADQTVFVEPLAGTNWYKTSVHDFVSIATGNACGPTSKTFYGVTYKFFNCGAGVTTYRKIYASTSALKVVVPI